MTDGLNHTISPIYQSILNVSVGSVHDGDPTESLFEPLLAWIERLMVEFVEVKM